MQILSPPASNERVDFYNNQLIMGLVPPCSNSSSTGSVLQTSNSQSLFHTPVTFYPIFFK